MTARTRRFWRLATAVGLSTFLVLAGTAGASAIWTTASASLGATANAATISSSLAATTALDTAYKYTTATSPAKIGMLTYTNTGSAPIAVTMSGTNNTGTFGSQLKLSLWTTTATACETTVPGTAVVGTVAAPPALPTAFASVAPGATVKLCLATSVTVDIPTAQGSTITPTFTLTGRVGTTWQTTVTNTFTQSIYRVPAPGTIDCVNGAGLNGGAVTLSWAAVTGATQYIVYKEDGSAVNKTFTTPTAALTTTDLGLDALVGVTRPVTVRVVAYDGTYKSTSVPTVRMIRVEPALIGLGAVLKCGS